MKTSNAYKIGRIAYPVLLYYVVSGLVYFALEIFFGDGLESYMLRQLICAAATIPFTFVFYREDAAAEAVVCGKKERESGARLAKNVLCAAFGGASLGVAVNDVLAMTPLLQLSESFQTANEAFFAGSVICEILGSCLVIPFAEELLFRGVVYRRLKWDLGAKPAIVLSAVIFGIMHFNIVQFLYAAALGLFLAFLLERTGKLYPSVIAHIAANLLAVIRTERGVLSFGFYPTAAGIAFTALAAAVFAGTLLLFCVSRR